MFQVSNKALLLCLVSVSVLVGFDFLFDIYFDLTEVS